MNARMKFAATIAVLCAGILALTTLPAAEAQTRPARSTTATAGNAPARAQGQAQTAPTTSAPEGVVNINAASEEELRRLPGIGPARAQAIVALRQRVQRFRAPDDLMRVRGIGRAGMRRLRPFITLTGETTLASRPGRAARTRATPANATASRADESAN